MTWRCMIVDDEPLALRKLRELVSGCPQLQLIGEASDGLSALTEIERLQPDLLFLDIQMPGLLGTDLVSRVKHHPKVIFTTAFEHYAVTAFELNALDYLVKPFGKERFDEAVSRLGERRDGDLAYAQRALDQTGPLQRIFVRERGRIVPLACDALEWIKAEREYAGLHAGGKSYLVRVPLDTFELRLDARFLRVHRSYIVNLDHVACLAPADGSRFTVQMKNGDQVPVSRERAKVLREKVL